ncbi:hypothetical protein [Psychroserpens burtonensis]|uniref:hypothetical protein n=1 Tax=Psychroserpens burtonensis TaxID=49278 RepID=UPI000418FBCF|nr:hypothetical protein [Psychroserpens burtonensis]
MKFNKNPVNVFNGLKTKTNNEKSLKIKSKSNLAAIQAYQNSKNITKAFVKPISKII